MKNTKAVFLIILGSFLMATGFAFAVESTTLNSSQGGVNFDGNKSVGGLGITKDALAPGTVPTTTTTPPPAPAPKKASMLETAQKFVGDNESQLIFAGSIGFLAFLIIGTGGAGLAFGLAAFGFAMFMKGV